MKASDKHPKEVLAIAAKHKFKPSRLHFKGSGIFMTLQPWVNPPRNGAYIWDADYGYMVRIRNQWES